MREATKWYRTLGFWLMVVVVTFIVLDKLKLLP